MAKKDERDTGQLNNPVAPSTEPDVTPPEGGSPDSGDTPDATPEEESTGDDFATAQAREAKKQNLGEGAVPERRPQAFLQNEDTRSSLTRRLEEEGAIPSPNDAPMGKEAYDAADDDARKEENASQGIRPAPHVGTVIRVTSGPHRDRQAAVIRVVSYPSMEDRVARLRGEADADYIVPKEIEVSFRGDARDGERAILDLEEIEYELVPSGFAGRASVSGAL